MHTSILYSVYTILILVNLFIIVNQPLIFKIYSIITLSLFNNSPSALKVPGLRIQKIACKVSNFCKLIFEHNVADPSSINVQVFVYSYRHNVSYLWATWPTQSSHQLDQKDKYIQ